MITNKNGVIIKKADKLNIGDIWYDASADVFQSSRIIGEECFYPVYKWKDYYSFSFLNLLRIKGNLDLNPKIHLYLNNGIIDSYLPPEICVDKYIKRIGAPLKLQKLKITSENSFIEKFAVALIKDIRRLEDLYPNTTFGILTGGKDSLNLLLLPWKAEIVALSGDPNYQLVKEFCSVNKLDIEVKRLNGEEYDSDDWIKKDTLFCCGRMGLRDIRWSKNIFEIKNEINSRNKNFIIISGTFGDAFLTTKFKHYRAKWKNLLEDKIVYRFQSKTKILYNNLWRGGAQWQAVNHGVIRESTNMLNFSAYHGKNVLEVLSQTDLEKVIDSDIRPKLGDYIFGKKVIYPNSNPSPAAWENRIKYSTLGFFLDTFKSKIDI
ncbi:hypothetical protein [Cecembia lonarensis]|uniref:Asparagine synthetase domain-containing protein n=1 Tax=Cecembia lonarensis (strain CCUG 58316 / KCTC 22772 / LW9) TaxID=1225176 RepID=K1KXA6_CECL9|nr:hypothetical protein [Cecembia lonarensis]EKB48720.1 hypothetical protein B879_02679 [Cecembia lonarensis LW9]